MTVPSPDAATAQIGAVVAEGSPPQLDYSKVRAYWKRARASMLGPYMMDGFGFPREAGRFRFRGEQAAVAAAIRDLDPGTSVLDLGSGAGVWTEYFAQRFATVVSVEASSTLYAAMKERCSHYPNVTTYECNVMSFDPDGEFGPTDGCGLVFLGGLLMYLDDSDAGAVLHNLISALKPGALVLCRESTIRRGVKALQGDYQVVYRSVEAYRDIFADAGFDVVSIQANTAYINVQMACELVKRWKSLVPDRYRCLPIVGRLAYWGLRLGYPWSAKWIPSLLARMGCEFPTLTNHFFVLRPSERAASGRRGASLHGLRTEPALCENER